MIKKITFSTLLLIIFGCSSTNISKENKKVTQVITYSGIKPTEDTYFKSPGSVLLSGDKLLITDTFNNLIRQIQDNKITTYAGNGKKENIDGKLLEASFNNPENIVIDSKNNIYTTVGYNQIQKIDPEGNVTLFAGEYSPGWIYGGNDGENEYASFKFISSLAIDKNDVIYVADENKIRKLTNGHVITIAGSDEAGDKTGTAKEARFNQISDIAINENGDIYVADQVNKKIKKVSSDGNVSGFIPKGKINWPTSLKFNSQGNLIIFDSTKKKFLVSDKQGQIINTFSNPKITSEDYYFKVKMYIDKKDNIIIPSKNFVNIIDTDFKTKQIGEEKGSCRNGDIHKATYDIPYDGVFDNAGNLYIIEKGNNLVRKISKEGIVSTFSGSGKYGNKDGENKESEFTNLNSITIDKSGNLYVLDGDWNNTKIRKIDFTGKTTTFIDAKKENLKWKRPSDIVCDSENNILVSDNGSNTIYTIDPARNITSYISPNQITFKGIQGLAMDKNDNLYACDSNNHRILKISKNKKTEIISPNNIELDEPENITVDDFGNLYVTDKNRTRIVQISKDTHAEIFLEESTLGSNKMKKFSEYYNTLKIEAFENNIFAFDKYNHQIIKLKQTSLNP